MRILLPTLIAVAAMTAPMCASAQKTPETIALGTQSTDGALLMRVPVLGAPYTFIFSKDGKTGFGSRGYMMKVPAGEPGMTYIGRTLRPGKYVLLSVFQQGIWGSCFHEGTIRFDIAPASVSYAGTFDSRSILQDIEQTAVNRHNTKMYAGTVALSFHPNARPEISEPDVQEISAAREFMARTMARTSAPLEVIRPAPVTVTVSKFDRAIQVCG